MARGIQSLINEALDAAVANGKVTADERPSLVQFAAYKGEVDGTDPQRYYLNAQGTEYLDIALSDIVAEVDLAGDSSPLVLVITKADALMQHHLDIPGRHRHAHFSSELHADFLIGDISMRHLSHSRITDVYYGFKNAPARCPSEPPCETGGSDC